MSILICLILLMLAGCSDALPSAEESSAQERIITLNLDITTRADADTEQSPDNFHLWIFSGNKLLKYINSNPTWQESVDDGIDLKAKVEAEIDATGITQIKFYLLLNTNVTNPWNITPDQLKTLTFTIPYESYVNDNKVPMSGEAVLDISLSQSHYDMEIDAVRSVAKLGIYCTKASETSELTIKEITLSKVPDKGYLFDIPVDERSIDYTKTGPLSLLDRDIAIDVYYSGTMPGFSDDSFFEDENSFIELSQFYLLENLNGIVDDNGFIQVDGQVPSDDRYCITLRYILNGDNYEKKIYVSQIERNQYSKIYIRINDDINLNDIYCQVNSWIGHEMDVPAFE